MSGWRIKREERDGELAPVPIYENPETDYDTQEEFEEDREMAAERRII